MTNKEAQEFIHRRIRRIQERKQKPILVAINGIEGTGKTTFAKALTQYLNAQKLNAIHVTIDGYHNPKKIRYRQGRDSAKGYYEDAYNEHVFVEKVLLRSQSDSPEFVPAIHDLATDQTLKLQAQSLNENSILVVDGAYLFKPVYRNHWDLKVYLKADFTIAMDRGIKRDSRELGGYESTKQKYLSRYHRASKMYIKECQPEKVADIIFDFNDFNAITLLKE